MCQDELTAENQASVAAISLIIVRPETLCDNARNWKAQCCAWRWEQRVLLSLCALFVLKCTFRTRLCWYWRSRRAWWTFFQWTLTIFTCFVRKPHKKPKNRKIFDSPCRPSCCRVFQFFFTPWSLRTTLGQNMRKQVEFLGNALDKRYQQANFEDSQWFGLNMLKHVRRCKSVIKHHSSTCILSDEEFKNEPDRKELRTRTRTPRRGGVETDPKPKKEKTRRKRRRGTRRWTQQSWQQRKKIMRTETTDHCPKIIRSFCVFRKQTSQPAVLKCFHSIHFRRACSEKNGMQRHAEDVESVEWWRCKSARYKTLHTQCQK